MTEIAIVIAVFSFGMLCGYAVAKRENLKTAVGSIEVSISGSLKGDLARAEAELRAVEVRLGITKAPTVVVVQSPVPAPQVPSIPGTIQIPVDPAKPA